MRERESESKREVGNGKDRVKINSSKGGPVTFPLPLHVRLPTQ